MDTTEVASKLIVKAARRWHEDSKAGTRTGNAVADTRLLAFAEVAADVLDIAMTPAHFIYKLKEALAERPVPFTTYGRADQAELERSRWAAEFAADVLHRLETL